MLSASVAGLAPTSSAAPTGRGRVAAQAEAAGSRPNRCPPLPPSAYLPVSTPPASDNDATTRRPRPAARRHVGVLHPVAADQAVGQLGGARLRHPDRRSARRRLEEWPGLQFTTPHARAAGGDQLGDRSTTRHREARPAGGRVEHVDPVESHAPSEPSSSRAAPSRARTPTTACCDDDRSRAPSRPPGTARRTGPRSSRWASGLPGLVVVASVVEEVDPVPARGAHHGEPGSRVMRSNVRHEPSERRETSSSEPPSRRCSMPAGGFMAGRLRKTTTLAFRRSDAHRSTAARRAERRGVPRTVRGPRPARLLHVDHIRMAFAYARRGGVQGAVEGARGIQGFAEAAGALRSTTRP